MFERAILRKRNQNFVVFQEQTNGSTAGTISAYLGDPTNRFDWHLTSPNQQGSEVFFYRQLTSCPIALLFLLLMLATRSVLVEDDGKSDITIPLTSKEEK